MNFFEAMEALKNGKRVRRKDWKPDKYFQMDMSVLGGTAIKDVLLPEYPYYDKWELYYENKSLVAEAQEKVDEVYRKLHQNGIKVYTLLKSDSQTPQIFHAID